MARASWVLAAALPLIFFTAPAPAEEPIHKIDRAKVVGPPVLDDTTPEGVYVWLEDGWFQLAAVTNLPFGAKKQRTRTYALSFTSTGAMTEKLGAFKKTGGKERSLRLQVAVGPRPERGQVKTEGEVTISEVKVDGQPASLFVGPLSKLAAGTVKIGRY
jgi:hypothetical protein